MKLAVTGGTGRVGRFIVEAALVAGHQVTVLSRTTPAAGAYSRMVGHLAYDLSRTPPRIDGFDAVIHAAFDHVPERYRGGEGSDPSGFLRRNLDGSAALFAAAAEAGVERVVFLSSRAVYDGYSPGTPLDESLPPAPITLYARAKVEAEQALEAQTGVLGLSLRATGVYGPGSPGRPHKWVPLFRSFRAGQAIEPRVGTELHGDDLAAAALLLLAAPAERLGGRVFHASDLVLDRHDLLAELARVTGWAALLPARAHGPVSVMSAARLRRLGWRPGGWQRLVDALPLMAAQV